MVVRKIRYLNDLLVYLYRQLDVLLSFYLDASKQRHSQFFQSVIPLFRAFVTSQVGDWVEVVALDVDVELSLLVDTLALILDDLSLLVSSLKVDSVIDK